MNNAMGVLLFVCGAAVGSVVTLYCVKEKYEQLATEEIESVKEMFLKKGNLAQEKTSETTTKTDELKEAKSSYREQVKDLKYVDYTSTREADAKVTVDHTDVPYIISPDEFGENEEYECVSLSYYADKVVADDYDEEVTNITETIGDEALNTFGDYEDDCVYVRNDVLKIDYEILLDRRRFKDIIEAQRYTK